MIWLLTACRISFEGSEVDTGGEDTRIVDLTVSCTDAGLEAQMLTSGWSRGGELAFGEGQETESHPLGVVATGLDGTFDLLTTGRLATGVDRAQQSAGVNTQLTCDRVDQTTYQALVYNIYGVPVECVVMGPAADRYNFIFGTYDEACRVLRPAR